PTRRSSDLRERGPGGVGIQDPRCPEQGIDQGDRGRDLQPREPEAGPPRSIGQGACIRTSRSPWLGTVPPWIRPARSRVSRNSTPASCSDAASAPSRRTVPVTVWPPPRLKNGTVRLSAPEAANRRVASSRKASERFR